MADQNTEGSTSKSDKLEYGIRHHSLKYGNKDYGYGSKGTSGLQWESFAGIETESPADRVSATGGTEFLARTSASHLYICVTDPVKPSGSAKAAESRAICTRMFLQAPLGTASVQDMQSILTSLRKSPQTGDFTALDCPGSQSISSGTAPNLSWSIVTEDYKRAEELILQWAVCLGPTSEIRLIVLPREVARDELREAPTTKESAFQNKTMKDLEDHIQSRRTSPRQLQAGVGQSAISTEEEIASANVSGSLPNHENLLASHRHLLALFAFSQKGGQPAGPAEHLYAHITKEIGNPRERLIVLTEFLADALPIISQDLGDSLSTFGVNLFKTWISDLRKEGSGRVT
jgi:hypothetical protein